MKLSRRDQSLLALMVIILIGFGFYWFVYLPMNKDIKTFSSSNQELQTQIKDLQTQVKKAPTSTGSTEDRFAHLDKRLPTGDEMIPLLTMLDETAGKHKLPFASMDYRGAEQPDATGAQTLVFSMSTKGKITQLLEFLDDLEKAERLISVEDVSFDALKIETQQTAAVEVEKGPPTYYIAPPGIPEAKLQRIKFEVVEEKETPVVDSEKPVASSFDPGKFEMKLTINAYYAGPDKANKSKTTDDSDNKPADGAKKTKGEV